MKYAYPSYRIDFDRNKAEECAEIGIRLLDEIGMVVRNETFRDALKGKSGVTIDGDRVKFKESLSRRNLEKVVAKIKKTIVAEERSKVSGAGKSIIAPRDKRRKDAAEWQLSGAGFSMAVLDVETDRVRPSTCQDLRDMIRLMGSYGVGGDYPVTPQDVPPIMQALAIYKICWETSDKVTPFDYQNIAQTDYIFEMYKLMGKTFTMPLNIPNTMTLSEHDLDIFLKYYPALKKGLEIDFWVLDYPMLGINKPITVTGCAALCIAENLGVYNLFKAFDPQLEIPITFQTGNPTDLRTVGWAFGHSRRHLFYYINSLLRYRLCGLDMKKYRHGSACLETGSSAIDEQAAMEKMGVALTAALQGARNFGYAGTLAADDLFSGVQFVIDVEIFNYVRDLVESFAPHPDIVSMDGTYEELRDVSLDKDQFLSHENTLTKYKNIMPVSDLLHHDKLRQWLEHKTTLKDRARKECVRRLKETEQSFHLTSDKQRELDRIYSRAEAALVK